MPIAPVISVAEFITAPIVPADPSGTAVIVRRVPATNIGPIVNAEATRSGRTSHWGFPGCYFW
ncbi:hypothetical protein KACC15558_19650 [Brevibacterium ammoniilyticum]|uniref:Uncharacterized protein n=1 Tax=Brevibacterium ammoniilyticum TaxID=1046555 RepID=A0ABP9U6M0_9MICO